MSPDTVSMHINNNLSLVKWSSSKVILIYINHDTKLIVGASSDDYYTNF